MINVEARAKRCRMSKHNTSKYYFKNVHHEQKDEEEEDSLGSCRGMYISDLYAQAYLAQRLDILFGEGASLHQIQLNSSRIFHFSPSKAPSVRKRKLSGGR